MTDDLSLLAGSLLVCLLCIWTVGSLASQISRIWHSHSAVDQTLGEVDKDVAPGLFQLQLFGLAVAMLAAATIGVSATVAMVAVFIRMVAA